LGITQWRCPIFLNLTIDSNANTINWKEQTVKRVYLETSVISYLAALPSRDLVKAARQEISWDMT